MKKQKNKKAPYWLSTSSAFSVMLLTLLGGLSIITDIQNRVFDSFYNVLIGIFGIFLLLVTSLFFHIVLSGISMMWKKGIKSKPE